MQRVWSILRQWLPLAAVPATLVDALDLTLTHGTMPAAMKQALITAAAPGYEIAG